MKRPCEDSSSADSELEESVDVGHARASFIRCGSPTTTTQVMARKKRRGIIEKRRRDRINNSLLELRRLVPTATEKQGSAKVEKAEILQMTVDHLKMLQATGGKGYLHAHALALDFLSLGFRECVGEVCRYLGAVEGRDSSDPLCARLLSHLASCASQREAAAALTVAPHHVHLLQQQTAPPPLHPHHWAALRPAPYGAPLDAAGGDGAPQRSMVTSSSSFSPLADSASSSPASSSSSSSSSSLVLPCAPTPFSTSLLSLSASFPLALHGGFSLLHPSTSSFTSSSSSQTRPYRPWGTEVGAF